MFYVKGNPQVFTDLKRCWAHKTVCCVIMNDQFTANQKEADYQNIMNALAFKKFTVSNDNDAECPTGIRVCLQLAKSEHKEIYFSGW